MNQSDEEGGHADRTEPLPESRRLRRPWWLPHFLGRVPLGLEERHLTLVGLVSLAAAFESYDLSMLTSALKQIRESFGLGQSEAVSLFAWIRLGAIPALIVVPLADRLGRRRVFLSAIVGMSVGTVVSGFATTPTFFVAAQTVTRTFLVAATACAVVIVAEELPARHRGWGVGMLGAIGSFGFGFGALLYAFVDALPWGWRTLYFVGGAPLFLLPFFRKRLHETSRFLQERQSRVANRVDPGAWISPLIELVREHPGRSVAVAAMAFLFSAGATPAFGLLSDFVQTTHGWEPRSYSLMALVAGGFGVVGNSVMGWAADRRGRRPMAALAFGFFPFAAMGVYYGPAIFVPFLWAPFVFFLTGGNVLLRIIATELFPTSSRNTAMGWETLMETLGGAAGFALVGLLTLPGSSIAPAAVAVSGMALLAVVVIRLIPETAGRELELTSRPVGD